MVLIVIPLVMNIITIFLSKLVLPEFVDHVLSRSSEVLSLEKILILLFQLAVLALGEEIAWRAFFQKRIKGFLPIIPAIVITSQKFRFKITKPLFYQVFY